MTGAFSVIFFLMYLTKEYVSHQGLVYSLSTKAASSDRSWPTCGGTVVVQPETGAGEGHVRLELDPESVAMGDNGAVDVPAAILPHQR